MVKMKWFSIPGYNDIYEISTTGEVRSLDSYRNCGARGFSLVKGRVLSPKTDKYGYHIINLYKDKLQKTYTIHRLMRITFFKPEVGLVINHKDRDKKNNILSNLEMVTIRENVIHGKRGVGKHGTGVSFHKRTKVFYSSIKVNGKSIHIGSFSTQEEARDAYVNKKYEIGIKSKY